ncbi:hypothetical protein E2C01_045418 [Portunus trituberculatus]|uniref:Secreted protein n=1 Tax=Portunus trituberculatus TaxID=210409 RepID=A0A5B7G210_PORTR|nr:hypothetical protein [Portunus trituberculatus]
MLLSFLLLPPCCWPVTAASATLTRYIATLKLLNLLRCFPCVLASSISPKHFVLGWRSRSCRGALPLPLLPLLAPCLPFCALPHTLYPLLFTLPTGVTVTAIAGSTSQLYTASATAITTKTTRANYGGTTLLQFSSRN